MAEPGGSGSSSEDPGIVVPIPRELERTIEALPKAEQDQVREQVRETIRIAAFQGPFPPPEFVAEYERFCPGFLKMLMDRALEAQRTEQDIDRINASGPYTYAARGQWMGYSITVLCIIGSVACAYLDQGWAAAGLSLGAVSPIVGHFLKNPLSTIVSGRGQGSEAAKSPPPKPPNTASKPTRSKRNTR